MLKKKHKLTGKDINFLFKKQQIVPGKYFSFIYFKQYPNRNYNQFSVQVPLKVSKKATDRNMIKRIIYSYLQEKDIIYKQFGKNYYKVFIVVNKKSISLFKETIETGDKKFIKNKVINYFEFSFNNLLKNLGENSGK